MSERDPLITPHQPTEEDVAESPPSQDENHDKANQVVGATRATLIIVSLWVLIFFQGIFKSLLTTQTLASSVYTGRETNIQHSWQHVRTNNNSINDSLGSKCLRRRNMVHLHVPRSSLSHLFSRFITLSLTLHR